MLLTIVFAALAAIAPPQEQGKQLFVRRCSGCHSVDGNKEGPNLRAVNGRQAGAVPGFGYSEALKKSNIHWDAASLDRWLTDPEAMVPDSDMAFRVADAQERSAIIAYLKTLGGR